MKVSRRTLLRSAAATALLPACRRPTSDSVGDSAESGDTAAIHTGDTADTVDTAVEPVLPGPEPADPWDPEPAVDGLVFAWGVQVGDVTPEGALVSVQTRSAELTLRLARATDAGWEEVLALPGLVATDGALRVELVDLLPDQTWAVCFEASGVRSDVSRFRTAPAAGASRVIRFGATSCFGSAGSPWPCMAYTGPEKLDFFVLLGDTIYADGGTGDEAWFTAEWRAALATEGLLALSAATSLVATWDDHEIDNDWDGLDEDQARQAAALASFRAAIPQREGPSGGLWRTLVWGDALELIVLDCRGERQGDAYIGSEQMAWLQERLQLSSARFKVIANSVPITDWNGTVMWEFAADDRWQGHDTDRSAILSFVEDNAIEGVLWIAGDHHFAAVTHVDPAGGIADEQVEVLCGPTGSTINPAAWLIPEDDRIPIVVREYNWVRFVCDPDLGTVVVSFIGDDGGVIAEIVLGG